VAEISWRKVPVESPYTVITFIESLLNQNHSITIETLHATKLVGFTSNKATDSEGRQLFTVLLKQHHKGESQVVTV
jgi:hypothetical protein